MALTLSRVDRIEKTYDLATLLAGTAAAPEDVSSVSVALLAPNYRPTAATVWYEATVDGAGFTVMWAGPDADSSGAIAVSGSADAWFKVVTTSTEVDAEKIERINVLGGGTLLAPASAQALIGLDTDGVPFYDPGGIGTPTGLAVDTDGVLYFTTA